MQHIDRLLFLIGKINFPFFFYAIAIVAPWTEMIDVHNVNLIKSFAWIFLLAFSTLLLSVGFVGHQYKGFIQNTFKKPENIFLLLFLLTMAFTCFISPWKNNLFTLKSLIIFSSAFFFVILSNIQFNKSNLVFLIKVLLFSAAFILLIAYYQILTDRYSFFKHSSNRLTSIFWDPNIYARYMIMIYILSISLLVFYKDFLRLWQKWFLIILSILSFIPFYLTYSRSGIILLSVACLLIFVFYTKNKFLIITALVFSFGVAYLGINILKQTERFKKQKNIMADYSNLNRGLLIIGALKSIQQNPIWGIGYNNFQTAYKKVLQPPLARMLPRRAKVLAIHNTPIEIWTEKGIFGLLFFLLWTFTVIWKGIKNKSPDPLLKTVRVWSVSSFIIFFLFGQIYFSYLYEPYFWLIAYCALISYNVRTEENTA